MLIKTVGDPTLANFVLPIFGVESGYGFAISARGQVKRDVIATHCRTLDAGQGTVTTQLGLDGRLDLFIRRRRCGQLDTQTAVARHHDAGANRNGGVEADRTGCVARGDVDRWRIDDVDVVLTHRTRQVLGNAIAQGLFTCRSHAETSLQNRPRGLAGTESGQPDFVRDLAERGRDIGFKLGLVNDDRQLDLVTLEGFDRTLHTRKWIVLVSALPWGNRRPN